MSEVYIRSQNREKLYRLGGNYACIEYQSYETVKHKKGIQDKEVKHELYISDGCLEELAEYPTKERCIEVLDEIQKICGQYLYAAGSMGLLIGSEATPPMAAEIPRVYEMPQE